MASRTAVPPAKSATKKTTGDVVDALAAAPGGIVEISLDVIDPHPDNPRKDVGDLEELTASITAQGVLQNVTLLEHPDKPGRYLALLGHRRVEASRQAGKPTVPARVVSGLSRAEQIELMLVENLQRTDLTPFEEGRSYQGLLDLDIPVAAIAERTGRAVSTVKTRLRLGRLDDRAAVAHSEHQLTLEQALQLAEIQEASPEAYKNLWTTAENNGVLRPWMIDDALSQIKVEARVAEFREKLEKDGVPLLDSIPFGAGTHRSLKSLGLKTAEHKTCPGHAAYIVKSYRSASLVYYCTDALTHHPDLDNRPSAPAAPDPERQAQIAALNEINDARFTWIADTFTIDSDENLALRDKIAEHIADELGRGAEWRAFLPLVGDGDEGDPLKASTPSATICFALTMSRYGAWINHSTLRTYMQPEPDSWNRDRIATSAEQIRTLQSWGYTPAALELEFLAHADAVAANAPVEASSDDDEFVDYEDDDYVDDEEA